MFDSYHADSMRFTAIATARPWIMAVTVCLNVLSLLGVIPVVVYLGLSWVDVGLGFLASAALSFFVAATFSFTATRNEVVLDWIIGNAGLSQVLATVLVFGSTIAGFAMVVGLIPALLIVLVPTAVLTPPLAIFRGWVLRTY